MHLLRGRSSTKRHRRLGLNATKPPNANKEPPQAAAAIASPPSGCEPNSEKDCCSIELPEPFSPESCTQDQWPSSLSRRRSSLAPPPSSFAGSDIELPELLSPHSCTASQRRLPPQRQSSLRSSVFNDPTGSKPPWKRTSPTPGGYVRNQDPVTVTTPPTSKQGAVRRSSSMHTANSVEDYCVSLLGSSGSGKTTLIRRLVYRVMEDEYTPTVEERYVAQLVVDGQPVRLRVLDQRGKPPSHPNPLAPRSALDSDPLDAQGILLAFSLKDRETYAYVQRVATSINLARYGDALVLVGTHSDCAPGERKVSAAEATALASGMGIAYIETSAMTHSCTYAFYLLARKLRQNAEPSSLLRQIHTLRMLYSSPSAPAVESSSLTSSLSRSSSFSEGTLSSTQFGKMRAQDQPSTLKNGYHTPPQSPPSSAKRLSLIEQSRADKSAQLSAKSPWKLRFKRLFRLST